MRHHHAIGLFVLASSLFACTIDARVGSADSDQPAAASEINSTDIDSTDPAELRFAVPAADFAKNDTVSTAALPEPASQADLVEKANARVRAR